MKISDSAYVVGDIISDMFAAIFKFTLLMIKPVKSNKEYQSSNYPECNFEV